MDLCDLPERIADKIQPEPNSGCWLWAGALYNNGYAQINGRSGSRIVYRMLRGDFDSRLQLDHLCRTPACVNPWHLEPVTALENLRRIPARFRSGNSLPNRRALESGEMWTAEEGYCTRGHLLVGDNLRIRPDGRRACRMCQQIAARLRARRIKEARTGRVVVPFAERTHCPKGHPYSGGNLRLEKTGWKRCRLCDSAYQRTRRAEGRWHYSGYIYSQSDTAHAKAARLNALKATRAMMVKAAQRRESLAIGGGG